MNEHQNDSHPDAAELAAFARGALWGRNDDRVRAHVQACLSCNRQVHSIQFLRVTCDAPRVARWRTHRRLANAAAIVLVAGIATAGAFYYSPGLTPAGPSSSAPVTVAATPDLPDLSHLATRETLSPLFLRLRFKPGTPVADSLATEELLRTAATHLADAQYGEATTELEDILRRFPADTEAAAYLGIALYLADRDLDRAALLLEAGTRQENPVVARTATWYLSNLFLRTGRSHEGRGLLAALSATRDGDGRRAEALLERIASEAAVQK